MKKEFRDRIDAVRKLDLIADFADDGVDGGDAADVLETLRGEQALGVEYGIRQNFSKMVVFPLAGADFDGDLSGFEEMGVRVDWSAWGEEKMSDIRK
eukprot:1712976-Karenia_brevis.AAC.1